VLFLWCLGPWSSTYGMGSLKCCFSVISVPSILLMPLDGFCRIVQKYFLVLPLIRVWLAYIFGTASNSVT
jgi:hypothetical protein